MPKIVRSLGKGLHATVALQSATPWIDEQGHPDMIGPEMIEKMAGRKFTLAIDTTEWHYLEGSAHNDEATGTVFYLAAFLDEASKTQVAELRTETR